MNKCVRERTSINYFILIMSIIDRSMCIRFFFFILLDIEYECVYATPANTSARFGIFPSQQMVGAFSAGQGSIK